MPLLFLFFFFNDTATTEIYTLSLHDALPIYAPPLDLAHHRHGRAGEMHGGQQVELHGAVERVARLVAERRGGRAAGRSEEHTSELQSQSNLVCRLLLEKKKKKQSTSSAGTVE